MNNNVKMLIFWLIVLVAAVGLYFYANSKFDDAKAAEGTTLRG